jgi:hypothetical protein
MGRKGGRALATLLGVDPASSGATGIVAMKTCRGGAASQAESQTRSDRAASPDDTKAAAQTYVCGYPLVYSAIEIAKFPAGTADGGQHDPV